MSASDENSMGAWRPSGTGATAVEADLVDLLYTQSYSNRYHPLVVFAIAAPFFLPYAPWWTLAVIVGLQLSGTLIANRLRARHAMLSPDADRRPWARANMWVTGICGASWGAAGALWCIPDSLGHQAFLTVMLAGGITGSMVSRAPYMPALRLFVLVSGAPLTIALALTGEPASQAIAALALIYASGVLGWGNGIHNAHRSEVAARRENERLLRELGAARDEAEARAEEADKAREAAVCGERAKAEFLATMSHEVRTPLNGIQGMAEVLQETPLDARQHEFLQVIRDSAQSLRVILDDILEISRMESGDVEAEETVFEPSALTAEVAQIAGPEARRKGLELTHRKASGVPASARGDNRRIRQVLVNLVGNAVKFTDAGSVRISVSVVQDETRELLRYAVTDTGIGIDPAILDRLFESFTQADQSATRRHGGGGLGLALARRLVSQMGGTISARSTPGEGSEFWFDLPLRRAQAPASTAAAATPGADTPGADTAGAAASHDVDPSRLQELESKLGADKTREIVEVYLETAWQLADAIGKAGGSGDVQGLVRATHDLKSAAGTIGLTGLAMRAGAMEAKVRAGDIDPALADARSIATDMAEAHAALVKVYPAAMR